MATTATGALSGALSSIHTIRLTGTDLIDDPFIIRSAPHVVGGDPEISMCEYLDEILCVLCAPTDV